MTLPALISVGHYPVLVSWHTEAWGLASSVYGQAPAFAYAADMTPPTVTFSLLEPNAIPADADGAAVYLLPHSGALVIFYQHLYPVHIAVATVGRRFDAPQSTDTPTVSADAAPLDSLTAPHPMWIPVTEFEEAQFLADWLLFNACVGPNQNPAEQAAACDAILMTDEVAEEFRLPCNGAFERCSENCEAYNDANRRLEECIRQHPSQGASACNNQRINYNQMSYALDRCMGFDYVPLEF